MHITPNKIEIKDLTHEDLVRLLDTGVEDSSRFGLSYDRRDYARLENQDTDDFRTDKCAKILLAGGSVKITDYDADGVGYAGGDVPFTPGDGDEVIYHVTLDRILDGLFHAANAEFIPSFNDKERDKDGIRNEREYVRDAFDAFSDPEGSDFDADYAEALVQIILFNEIIYC